MSTWDDTDYDQQRGEARHERAMRDRRERHPFDPTCGCELCGPQSPDEDEEDEDHRGDEG